MKKLDVKKLSKNATKEVKGGDSTKSEKSCPAPEGGLCCIQPSWNLDC